MKIFAKRKRTAVDAETAEKLRKEQEAQKKLEADKQVQELLKLDPSTLNAKQRRLVKRYKQRTGDVGEEKQEAAPTNSKISSDEIKKAPDPKPAKVQRHEESSSYSSDSSSDDESVEASDDKNEAKKEAKAQTETKEESNPAAINTVDDIEDGGLNEDGVKKLLEKLNSKQRRKLMRRLEREGNTILEEVHAEATKLLKDSDSEKTTSATSESLEANNDTKPTMKQASGKKRKKDWSDLPPEERLRREEQRRMQQEAAARRAMEGPNATKRHPLNSERRRANRRKPKWESKRQPVENEHDTSGYHMRKLKKAGHI